MRLRAAAVVGFVLLAFALAGCLPPTVPSAPTTVSAAPGDGGAWLSWNRPNAGGSAITGYEVTPTIAGVAQAPVLLASTATTATWNGLTNGTSFSFTVAAVNAVGTGDPSPSSAPIIIGTRKAPEFVTASPGNSQATVSWWPPNDGTLEITGSTITPYDGDTALPAQTFSGSARSQTVTGLTNGTTYTFRVALIDAFGTGPSTTSAAVMVGIPPDAPTDPVVVPGNGSATVSWTAPSGNGIPITSYVVTPWLVTPRRTDGLPPLTFPASSTTQTITGLTNGSNYFFVIQALNAIGASRVLVTPTIEVGLVPSTPPFPTAHAGDTSATVSWWMANGNGSPILGYIVVPYIGATPQTPRTFASTATTQTITGLTNGTQYTFRVAAYNIVGTGPANATAAVTPAGLPAAPAPPSATPGNASVTLTWVAPNANGSPITGYAVTPYPESGSLPTQTFASTATTQSITGLTNGTTYRFRVAAINGVGVGPESAPSDAIVAGSPSAPGTPVATAADTSATLTWTAADGHGYPIIGYVITPYIGSAQQTVSMYAGAATTQTVTGLTNGTTYTFTVTAVSDCPAACAIGIPSARSNAVTPPGVLPGAPGSPTAQPGDRSATVSWTPADGHGAPITGYVVTPYIGAAAQTAQTFASSATTQTVTGLSIGTTYTFRVAAMSGVGTGPSVSTAAIIVGRPATAIASGELFSCAVLGDGTAQCWGANGAGQLADGTRTDRYVPAPVVGLRDATAISAGWSHACTVQSDHTVRCWGWNPYGQLGNGTINNFNTAPLAVPGLTDVTAVAAGFGHTCALLATGTVECWGWNGYGQLGDGTTTDRTTPVPVTGLSGVTAITTGQTHTCALLSSGAARCWGRNNVGQLGDGTKVNRTSPVDVPGLSGVTGLSAGWQHSCAVLDDTTARCWGWNAAGQLGNGTTTTSTVPVVVQGLTGVASIAAGGSHTCARLATGVVACAGGDGWGELGDGTTTGRPTMQVVPGLTATTAIATGLHTSCALSTSGNERCWGRNTEGQVGDDTVVNRLSPVIVHGF